MSLPTNNKNNNQKGNKNQPGNTGGSKFIAKPTKASGAGKKPVKTGGSRGS